MEAHSAKQMPALLHLFHSNGLLGFVIILLGLLLIAQGILNLAITRTQALFLAHGLLCFVPFLWDLSACSTATRTSQRLLMSLTAAKLKKLAHTMSFVMACGIFGGIATMLLSILSSFAFAF